MPPKIRDRIVGLRRIKASDLVPHPENWRRHPNRQRAILSDVLDEIGIADAVIVQQLPEGRFRLIDGHLRRDVLGDAKVPALVLDVDDDEARKLLLSLDPLAGLAEKDREALRALTEQVEVQTAGLEDLIRSITPGGLRIEETEPPPRPSKPKTRRGDLWLLGDHRVLCGDATDPLDVEKVAGGGLG